MRLVSITVENYLSFGPPCEVHLDECAALIGKNNAGKSNFMRAIELLCEGRTAGLGRESFHRKNVDSPIEIKGVFANLTEDERERLAAWLDGNELKLVRRFRFQGGDDSNSDDEGKVESEVACVLRRPREEWLNDATINKELVDAKKAELDTLAVGAHLFRDHLPDPSSSKVLVKDWKPAAKWFRDNCPGDIEWVTEEVPNPKGLTQVLQHNLPEVIRIAAVRDLADETKILKTNAFGQIMGRLVDSLPGEQLSAMESSLAEPLRRLNRDAGDNRLEPFAKLDREVNARLSEHMDCDLDVRVQPPAIGDILRSSIRLYAEDAGHITAVEQKGHGLQRSVIFALLRTYADRDVVFGQTGTRGRACIFLIEEPELYLHPHLQRRGMQTLLQIGAAGDQVIYSTHSPLFVDFSLFDTVRVLRTDPGVAEGATSVHALPMQRLVDDTIARNDDAQNPDAIRSAYRHSCDVREAEGLFAKRVIVVEGATEAAAIPIYANATIGHSLDTDSVSVVSCDGAGGIARLCRIYAGFGIPLYPIVDWHGGGQQDATVRKVADLFDDDLPDHVCTNVGPKWAVLEHKWETLCRQEIANYDSLEAAAMQALQCDSKQAIARFIAHSLVRKGQGEGDPAAHIPETIKQIVAAATTCVLSPGVLKQ